MSLADQHRGTRPESTMRLTGLSGYNPLGHEVREFICAVCNRTGWHTWTINQPVPYCLTCGVPETCST